MRTSVSLLCATVLLAAIISTASGRPKKCEPGETHMEDCNICKCNNDGTSFACTRRGCPLNRKVGRTSRGTLGLPPNRSVYPIPHSWTSKSVTPVNVTKKEQLQYVHLSCVFKKDMYSSR